VPGFPLDAAAMGAVGYKRPCNTFPEESAMNAVNIPLTVTPEAAARIAELGFQKQVEEMIEYARQHFPKLLRIEVVLTDRYDMGGPPGVTVKGWTDRVFDPADKTQANLTRWEVTTFPPEVLEHLNLRYY
jgi:hypothetical protein